MRSLNPALSQFGMRKPVDLTTHIAPASDSDGAKDSGGAGDEEYAALMQSLGTLPPPNIGGNGCGVSIIRRDQPSTSNPPPFDQAPSAEAQANPPPAYSPDSTPLPDLPPPPSSEVAQPATCDAGGVAQPQSGAGCAEAPPVDPATVLAGDATSLAAPDAKCPPGVSIDQMMNADGGLLKSLGNQTLKGSGAKGLQGGIKDNLAKKSGGTDASQIGTDPDITWRALQNLQAFKNTPGSDGKPVPDNIRHNGNVSGLQPSHEVARGSTLGELQDWFKGAIDAPNTQLPKGDKVDDNGVETSGLQQAGQKLLAFLSKVAAVLKSIVDNTIGKIPFVGKILSAPMDLVAGSISDGLKAAADAAGGHLAAAKQDGKDMGKHAMATVSAAASQASDLVNTAVGWVPWVGKEVGAAARDGAALIGGTSAIVGAAADGRDVGEAAKDALTNVAAETAGATVGMIDPTGIGSGKVQQGVSKLLADPESTATQS
jgi:hypothetical protein